MTDDEIKLPKISWSRNDCGTFREVENGWNPALSVGVYWITPGQAEMLFNYFKRVEAADPGCPCPGHEECRQLIKIFTGEK